MLCNCGFTVAQSSTKANNLESYTNEELIICIEEYLRSDAEITNLNIDIFHERAIKQLHKLNIAKSYFYYSYLADVEGSHQEAITYIYKALKVNLNEEESEFLFRIYSLRGKLHEQYGKESKALDDFLTSQKIAVKYNNDVGRANAITNLGKLRRKAEEYRSALEHSKKAYKIAMKPDYTDEISRINIIMGVGGAYLKLKQPDSALIYINKGIERSRVFGDNEGVSYFYIDYGIAYLLKGNYLKALDYFEKAEKIILEIKNQMRLVEVYYYIAKCQHILHDYEQSIVFIEKAIAIINEENEGLSKEKQFIPYEYVDLLKLLIKNQGKLGNQKELADYDNTLLVEIDERKEKNDEIIRNKLFNYLNEKSDVSSVKDSILLQQKYINHNKALWISLFVLATLFIIGCVLFYRNQRKKKARFRELNIKIAALRYEQRTSLQAQTQLKKKAVSTQPKKEVVITDKKVTAILQALKKFEQQEHYLDTNCNLRFVAKKVKTNATYLSKIINTDKGISFNEYITDLRMQYTLKRLQKDPLFRAYSVKSIAQEVGYKSADSFTKHFKNYTKLYPSYYIKSLKKNA